MTYCMKTEAVQQQNLFQWLFYSSLVKAASLTVHMPLRARIFGPVLCAFVVILFK